VTSEETIPNVIESLDSAKSLTKLGVTVRAFPLEDGGKGGGCDRTVPNVTSVATTGVTHRVAAGLYRALSRTRARRQHLPRLFPSVGPPPASPAHTVKAETKNQ